MTEREQGGCGSCGGCGECGGCSGCGAALELTEGELSLLQILASVAFLPVARRADSEVPVCLEDAMRPQPECSAILQHLERKGLIDLDYTRPLVNFDAAAYAGYPLLGSMALTARGQSVVEALEIQGITENSEISG